MCTIELGHRLVAKKLKMQVSLAGAVEPKNLGNWS